jgi:glutathione S-transferase
MTVRLFGLRRSVYTRIARLALAEKQVPHELCEVERMQTRPSVAATRTAYEAR